MIAILIDPFDKSVSYADVGSTDEAATIIGCDGDLAVTLMSDSDHLVIARRAIEVPGMRFWSIPSRFQGPVAGRALIRGNTPDGRDIVPVSMDLAELRDAVQFLDIQFAGWMPTKPRFKPLEAEPSSASDAEK